MKSYINRLFKKEEVPYQWQVKAEKPSKEELEKKMRVLVRSRKQMISEAAVSEGCIVMVSAQSEEPKYNKKVLPVTVGEGLLNPEFESALIGMKEGEEKEFPVQEIPVKAKVLSIRKTVFPEPTDEDAAKYCLGKEELAGIETVAAYREYLIREAMEEQHQMALGDAAQAIYQYVLNHSDWEFDPQEKSEWVEHELEFICRQLQDEGKDLDTLTTEDYQNYFGISSKAEMNDFLMNQAEVSIASLLWLAAEEETDPKEIDLMNANMNWSFLMDYVGKKLEWTEEKEG